eukprot:CAMPEP_0202872426 /NCGR_PEP_ID=MMETSP1391-20130828/21199_1 /ASSEMBLY_ACC=CAM_ASM_000867 /TAXON_ID=1034604 /ORGANISM="Chlamydomonas leiostraca, Strain SAG 11-49" /LENGTH=34 /DNA_ID= /DNA_START= /DNA_END= /DNA_ORIENTATION=
MPGACPAGLARPCAPPPARPSWPLAAAAAAEAAT